MGGRGRLEGKDVRHYGRHFLILIHIIESLPQLLIQFVAVISVLLF
jgi:hypothetical protein